MKSWEDEHAFSFYPRHPIELVSGRGALVWDSSGAEYIDCAAGHGVANVGHCNTEVVSALTRQAEQLITCPVSFYNPARALMLKKLADVAPAGLDRVFLCNSGGEAVEAALKFARFTTGKTGFIAAVRGFHGRTLGALSVTFNPSFRKEFEPLIEGVTFVPFNRFGRLAETVREDTAAVILEIVQGEGGVRIGDPAYFRKVRRLCSEKNVILIIDEIQTGFCRTGKFWACQHAGIFPDILCAAKGIAGGVAMGATLCSSAIPIPAGKHGSTFGGNPLACAAATAAIDFMLRSNLAGEAAAKGEFFSRHFPADLKIVREVRQLGLMIGIELRKRAAPYLDALLERGIIALPAGKNVIRLLPPLVITTEQLQTVIRRLEEVLR